jgi:hypothetical protein
MSMKDRKKAASNVITQTFKHCVSFCPAPSVATVTAVEGGWRSSIVEGHKKIHPV